MIGPQSWVSNPTKSPKKRIWYHSSTTIVEGNVNVKSPVIPPDVAVAPINRFL